MSGDKERFIEILSNEKNEIEELKKIVEDKSNLSAEIRKVKAELKMIEDTLNIMDKKFKDRLDKINKLNDEVALMNLDIQIKDINNVIRVINNNLPSGYYVEDKTENEIDNENSLKCMELLYNSQKDIYLKNDKDKNPPIKIGDINISITKEKQFKIDVILKNKENFVIDRKDFTIPYLYRVHKIIEWIILNLHYYE